MPTPKTWRKEDIPTPNEMEAYLSRIQAVRYAFPGVSGFPPIPPDMNRLTFETANNLEQILLQTHELFTQMKKSRMYAGETASGGF